MAFCIVTGSSSGNGFDPTGGTVEFSGSVAQTISLASGNNFYDLHIWMQSD